MDLEDLHPVDDYSHRFFIWHEWIQANGLLTQENVFDYFATSMFYDKQSNNQVLRMQTMLTGQPLANEAEQLKRFTGIEFAVVHSEPPSFFIIHKRERLSPEEVRPLAAYFIMNNRIYQSPDVYTILSNRLLTSLHSIQTSLDILRTGRPEFTPRTGFIWPIVDPSLDPNSAANKLDASQASESEDTAAKDADANAAASPTPPPLAKQTSTSSVLTAPSSSARKHQNFMPLLNAMRITAQHSNLSFAQQSAEQVQQQAHQQPLAQLSREPSVVAATRVGSEDPAATLPAIDNNSNSGQSKAQARSPTNQEAKTPLPGPGKKKKKRMSNAPPAS